MEETHRTGVSSEFSVASKLSKNGEISIPKGKTRYDLIIDFDNTLYRVQVKTAYRTGQNNDGHVVQCCGGGFENPSYYEEGEIDILAAYCREYNRVAYIPWIDDNVKKNWTIWFDRSIDEFRPCNRGMANIASDMTFNNATETLK